MNQIITKRCSPIEEAIYQDGFQAGAASRDAEIADLLEANRIACEDLVEQQNLRVKYAGQIEELVAALEHILAGSLSLPRFAEAEAIAVIAKVRKP